jgi:hypothetical protein
MEEAAENGKHSSLSARANRMNESTTRTAIHITYMNWFLNIQGVRATGIQKYILKF